MKTEIKYIGPDEAKEILSRNTENNRNLSINSVQTLARAMSNGEWKLNGETIIIDSDGKLINGQHRMSAVIESGQTVPFLICYGVDPSSFTSIDCGRTRTAGDIFSSAGISNANAAASICNGVLNYRHSISLNGGKGGSWNTSIRFTKEELVKEYRKHECEYSFAVHNSKMCKEICKPSIAGIMAALALIEAGKDKEKVNEFWRPVVTGEMLTSKDPRYVIRERFIKIKSNQNVRPTQYALMLTALKCWNKYIEGEDMVVLRLFEGEKIPRML